MTYENVAVDDIIHCKSGGTTIYCQVTKLNPTGVNVEDLEMKLVENHIVFHRVTKESMPHKGTLGYTRKIFIMDRNELIHPASSPLVRSRVNLDDLEESPVPKDEDDFDPLPNGFEAIDGYGTLSHAWCVTEVNCYHDGNDCSRKFQKQYLEILEEAKGGSRHEIPHEEIIGHALGYGNDVKARVAGFTYNEHTKRVFWHSVIDRKRMVTEASPNAPIRVKFNMFYARRVSL